MFLYEIHIKTILNSKRLVLISLRITIENFGRFYRSHFRMDIYKILIQNVGFYKLHELFLFLFF